MVKKTLHPQSAWIKLRTSLLPRLTENETEFRRYTHFFFFLLFFRTSWRNRVNRGEERRKSLTFSFSLFFSFSLSRVSLLVKISRNSKLVGWKRLERFVLLLLREESFFSLRVYLRSSIISVNVKSVGFEACPEILVWKSLPLREKGELLKLWNELRLTRFLSG